MSDSLDETVPGRGPRALGVLLLLVCAGCPETWGIEGTMDRAMSKDIQQMGRRDKCPLSIDEQKRHCVGPEERVQRECPPECQP